MSQKFVIIDGSSLVHRAFYALPLLTTAGGLYTNAVYGFATMLIKLLDDVKPDAVAVAFDKGKVTFRNETYAEYKGQRKATPAELSEQFPLVHQLLDAFGVYRLEVAGYEADDIIGTLATKAIEHDYEVIIVTGDRDALQLLQPSLQVMMTRKGISDMEVFDGDAFRAKYGIDADQLIDLKGLMGDASDNIPGVPGIGEKTAVKLIGQYGSVENVIQNIDNISGKKLQENLRNNVELAILSKKLATIVRDMSLPFLPEEYGISPDTEKVRELLVKFEFKSLLARAESVLCGNINTVQEVSEQSCPQSTIITTLKDCQQLTERVKHLGVMIYAPVIAGHIPDIQVSGMAVMIEEESFYIDSTAEGWNTVLELFSDDSISKITYDVKKVYIFCRQTGRSLRGRVFDCMLAAYLLDPTGNDYSLPSLSDKYCGIHYATGKTVTVASDFAGTAVQQVQKLHPVLLEALREQHLETLYYEIEYPLVEVLAAMENWGIRVDGEHLKTMTLDISEKVEVLLHEIYQLAGEIFNVNSPKQLGSLLFDKLGLPIIKKTKTGYSTDAEVLEKLSGSHPIVDKLLEFRLLTKLKSTYLEGLQGLIHKTTGRIHTTFNQMVTATGRLSSSDPNLQNIPIRTDIGRRIREVFIPGESYQWLVSADYSQIELRILAHMSGDFNLTDAFIHNQDIHTRTASEVFGVPMDEVTAEMRSRAKAVNFGIVYGISDYGLSRDLGVTRKEAAQYIDSYFEKCAGVKTFIDSIVAEAHQKGYVTTMFGRRRHLPDINSSNFNQRSFAERTAMNTPIQGTAADIIKKAMIDVYQTLIKENLRSRILLQVHDELVLEVPDEEVDIVCQVVKQKMEQAVTLQVPLVAEVKLGRNWAEAK